MKDLNRFVAPLARRVQLMLARAVVRLVSDASGLQTLQLSLLANETRDGVERFQEYGFTSHPLPGAVALAGFIGGVRDHGIVLAVDDARYRLKTLGPGEVALYNQLGTRIVLRADGSVLMQADAVVRVEAPRLECTGDIIDNCDTNSRSMAGMRAIYNTHTHPENDSGGPTDTPIQVMT